MKRLQPQLDQRNEIKDKTTKKRDEQEKRPLTVNLAKLHITIICNDSSPRVNKEIHITIVEIHKRCFLISININEIHFSGAASATTYKLKKSSNILKVEIAFMTQLHKWLGEKCKWNLCYRASRDGWSGQDFHRLCDNKGPTVVLIKANDCIFGGYTDQHWESGM